MKVLRIFIGLVVLTLFLNLGNEASAQCAMCSANAENSVQNGNSQGKGLNNGILYLLATPYLAVAAVGFIWYRNYRKKNVVLHIKNEKLNLN